MLVFCSYAMKPSAEKMAKPATKLVPLFRRHKYRQSLKTKNRNPHKFRSLMIIFRHLVIDCIQICNRYNIKLTCNSYCCTYCNFQEQLDTQCKGHRSKISESQHPSIPTRQTRRKWSVWCQWHRKQLQYGSACFNLWVGEAGWIWPEVELYPI